MILHTEHDIENYLRALAGASQVSMGQVAGLLAELERLSNPAGRAADKRVGYDDERLFGERVAPLVRKAEAIFCYQRGYQAALSDVARAVGSRAPVADLPAAATEPCRATSLAELFEHEYLALGVCVGPGVDV